MKAKTRKASHAARAQARKRPFFSRTGEGAFFKPIQTKMAVSHPGDKLEQEAEHTADKVMRMADPVADKLQRREQDKLQRQENNKVQRQDETKVQRQAGDKFQRKEEDTIQSQEDDKLQRREDDKILRASADDKAALQRKEASYPAPREEEKIFRAADGQPPPVTDHIQSSIQRRMTGGDPLAADVCDYMEPRFDADFGNVRIHQDGEAAGLSNRLGARAFTYQNHVFFSRGQYQPGTSNGNHLLAHELTHTIQQGHAVQRAPQVSPAPATPTVQRLGIQDALDRFAEWAYAIPGFRLLTLIIGFNPINMRAADRSAANILRGMIELIPGGSFITQALDNHGVINKAATWVESKLSQLGDIGADLHDALDAFLDSLSWTDIFHLGDVWNRAKRIFTAPIARLISFAVNTARDLLKIVKDAILQPLAAMAQGTRGYDLLCVLLGRDPITDQPVPPTAANLLGGFMKLIGKEEIWLNIQRGHAVERAFAWFHQATAGLMALVNAVPQRIMAAISSLTFQDILTIVGAFSKIVGTFVSIAGGFILWGLGTIWNLLEIIIDVVKPGLMGYIRRTGAALKSILRNPIPFMRNLIRAAQLGFTNFAAHFVTHLKEGIIGWLTGSLHGVYLPRAVTLVELGKFALSVLGITWERIRAKIVRALGPNGERTMLRMEQTVEVVRTLATGGIAAVWEQIKARLTNLKDVVIDGIVSFITTTIITKAVPKLLALFIPGAGFISAIITIYDTIMVFVHKLATIARVVMAFVNSIVAIAAGKIAPAAARIESALAGLLTLAISFLAGFLGLSKIAEKVMGVVQKVRVKVDAAMTKVVNKIVGKARSLFRRTFGGRGKSERRTNTQRNRDKQAALSEAAALVPEVGFSEAAIRSQLGPLKSKYHLSSLILVVDAETERTETIHFTATASPPASNESKTVMKGPVTLAPVNSWIINKSSGNRYEQVTSSRSTILRVNGEQIPKNFMTAIPDSGTNLLDYSTEGHMWERTDFVHKSKLVVPIGSGEFKLQPTVPGTKIRDRFYEDSSSIHNNIKNGRKASLMVDTIFFRSEGVPAQEQRFGYQLDPNTELALVPWSESSADHQPPIASHWTNGNGNNTNQQTRKYWNSDPSTYKIMSGNLNSSLGSRGINYTQLVGIRFRGQGEPE